MPTSSSTKPQSQETNSVGPSGIVWTTAIWRAGDLYEWEKNPRRITDSQAKHLATSLIKFGYVDPIQINTDGTIVGGHMRYRILMQAGMINADSMIEVRVPSRELSDEEFEELAIRLNRNTGTWDFDILTAAFDQNDLREWGFSPMDFGMGDSKPGAETPFTPSPLTPTNLQPSKNPKTCPHCGGPL